MVLIFSEDPGLDPHINTGIRREMRWAGAAAGQNTVTHCIGTLAEPGYC